MKGQKISLHQSGKRHIAFDPDLELADDDRFLDQWWEPQCHNGSKIVPTFNLYFPSWAQCLTQAIRDTNVKTWDKFQVFIEAAESPVATIVSFVITDEDLKLRFSAIGESPCSPLAVLPTSPGEKLWVIARYVPEDGLKELRERGIGYINATINDPTLVEKIKGFPNGHVLGISMGGNSSYGGKYLMPFPVELHGMQTEETSTD